MAPQNVVVDGALNLLALIHNINGTGPYIFGGVVIVCSVCLFISSCTYVAKKHTRVTNLNGCGLRGLPGTWNLPILFDSRRAYTTATVWGWRTPNLYYYMPYYRIAKGHKYKDPPGALTESWLCGPAYAATW